MLHYISIALEAVIVVLALQMVFVKKRYIGVGFAITFGLYAFYDLARAQGWGVSAGFLNDIFFIATLSALVSVWYLGRRKG